MEPKVGHELGLRAKDRQDLKPVKLDSLINNSSQRNIVCVNTKVTILMTERVIYAHIFRKRIKLLFYSKELLRLTITVAIKPFKSLN